MIKVENFQKVFRVGFLRKRFVAAKSISFEVEPKEIFGFLGPNGAGKTTTIKALLGLIRPDGGKLELMGAAPTSMAWRAQLGYMPEHPTFYEYLTGFEVVVWFGRLAGLVRHQAEIEAKKHLGRVGLEQAMHRRLRSYSKGMLQRAGLAQALVGSPKLLILDEPMTGLDPIGRRDMRELILDLRAEGRTVFYSTHILPDVEMTCDRVSIIHRGETMRTGRLQDILSETTRGVSVVLKSSDASVVERLRQTVPAATVRDGLFEAEFPSREQAQVFLSEALKHGADLVRFEPHRDSLEAIFLKSLGSPGSLGSQGSAEGPEGHSRTLRPEDTGAGAPPHDAGPHQDGQRPHGLSADVLSPPPGVRSNQSEEHRS